MYWNVSVKDLLMNFQGALVALVPWLEKSKIPFVEGESYDDWDMISSTLYETMVINSIKYSTEFSNNQYPFAKYDYPYDNYEGLSFILAENPEKSSDFTIFVSLNSNDKFKSINVCRVSKLNMQVVSKGRLKLNAAEFYVFNESLTNVLNIEL